ncbi:WXG100 family type VII secretion target [Catenuloplanes atrovinosus]|uniref:WXG100 family type VII secretion target n=1 Tax=Catenuloplanes atrovinosus TaxID=137266 RepID=A0AAE3YV04_9ACTN|nr:WXG100 family type VII secretion target [Catenuloplanes atrovinosus]MDR7279682.1 WXG100 family type VII secretion target [Catenuloplanes atrovinosus]
MTEETTVDPAVLAGMAARCDDAAGRMRALLRGWDAGGAAWRGAGGRAFDDARADWEREREALVDALTQAAVLLRATAARYVAADDDAGADLAGLFGVWTRRC